MNTRFVINSSSHVRALSLVHYTHRNARKKRHPTRCIIRYNMYNIRRTVRRREFRVHALRRIAVNACRHCVAPRVSGPEVFRSRVRERTRRRRCTRCRSGEIDSFGKKSDRAVDRRASETTWLRVNQRLAKNAYGRDGTNDSDVISLVQTFDRQSVREVFSLY